MIGSGRNFVQRERPLIVSGRAGKGGNGEGLGGRFAIDGAAIEQAYTEILRAWSLKLVINEIYFNVNDFTLIILFYCTLNSIKVNFTF
jgi:hypothetical protein